MALIQANTMFDLSDRHIDEIEQAFSPELRIEAEEAFRRLDAATSFNSSASSDIPRRSVDSELAEGEPIQASDLRTKTDLATHYASKAELERISISRSLKNIGLRVKTMRQRKAK